MKLVKIVVILTESLLLMALIQARVSFAQERNRNTVYESFSLTPDCIGNAEYEYVLNQGRRVYDGSFYFNSSERNSIDPTAVLATELYGDYSMGLKSGIWKFSKSELSPSGEAMGMTRGTYSVNVPAMGKQRLISGEFKNGNATGTWTSGTYVINQGRITDSLGFWEAQLEENRWAGPFSGHMGQFEISGNVDKEGFADGVWVVLHNNGTTREERRYASGVLIEHRIIKDGVQFTVQHLGENVSDEFTMDVEISSDYMDVLYQTSVFPVKSGNKTLELQEVRRIIAKGNAFVEESLFRFLRDENVSIWDVLPGSTAFQLPKIKVNKYPFSEQEKSELEHISELLANSKEMINSFLTDPLVDLSIHREEDIAYRYRLFTEYRNALDKLNRLVVLFSRPSFEFVDRTLILPYLAENIVFPEEVGYSYEGREYKRESNFPNGLTAEMFSISSINALLESIHLQLIKETNEARPFLDKMKRESEVSDKEKELLGLRDSLRGQFTNTFGLEDYNSYHTRYSTEVMNYIERRFADYAKLALDERVETIDQELVCFQQFMELYDFLAGLPAKVQDIEGLYTRTIWNPFTFTDMQEVVKERVFNAYQKTLLPFALQDLEDGLTCASLEHKMHQFSQIFQTMKDLRERDTSELESQLKRSSTIEEVIIAFKLNFEPR